MKEKYLKISGILLIAFAVLAVAAAFFGVFRLNADVNSAVVSKQSYEAAITEYTRLAASVEDGKAEYEAAVETMAENQTSYEIGREQYDAEKVAYDAAEAEYNAAMASSQYEDVEKAERLKAELDMQKGRLDALKSSLSVYEDAAAKAERYESDKAALTEAETLLRENETVAAALDSGSDIHTAFSKSLSAKGGGYSTVLYLYVILCFGAVFAALAASLGLSLTQIFNARRRTFSLVLSVLAAVLCAGASVYCLAAGLSSSICLITNGFLVALLSAIFAVVCGEYPSKADS